jgi:hypothetical protein
MSRYSQGVAEIVEDAFCKGKTVLLPQVFVHASCRAELDAGAAVRLFGAKAACDVFSALCFEVAAISRERSASLVRRRKKRSSFIRHLLRVRDQEANARTLVDRYSARRACAGSRRVARQAGRAQAEAAAIARTSTTSVKTLQSKGLMP